MLLQVHDELLLEVETKALDEVKQIAQGRDGTGGGAARTAQGRPQMGTELGSTYLLRNLIT